MIVDVGNKYIHFELYSDSGKTQRWLCRNKSSQFTLGYIQWYGAWRQYTFMPVEGSEYNNGCLDAISSFLARLNKEKRILQYGKLEVPEICHDDPYEAHKQIFDTSISTVNTGEGRMP